jgi:hypothetical protein
MLVLPSESFGGGPGEPVGVVAGPRSRLLALLRGVFGPKSLVQPLSDPTRHRHIGQPSHTPTDSSARADADSPGTGDATTVSTRVPSRPRSRRGGGHLAREQTAAVADMDRYCLTFSRARHAGRHPSDSRHGCQRCAQLASRITR